MPLRRSGEKKYSQSRTKGKKHWNSGTWC
uniref:Uncharacterized protein n=1 Tax=Arundo donax TaxID=35708 RepID=A0A0A9CH64_ARUDO